jgi:hypothetical protein
MAVGLQVEINVTGAISAGLSWSLCHWQKEAQCKTSTSMPT